MARYELHYAGTPDQQRVNPFTRQMQTFKGKPKWTKSLVVTRRDSDALVRWGTDDAVRTAKRPFATEAEARAFIDALTASYLTAGWSLVSNEEVDPVSVPVREPLFERMVAGDDGAFQVYADHLLERGDPRGDFMSLEQLEEPAKSAAITKMLRDHGAVLCGPLATRLQSSSPTWRHGYLDSVRIEFQPGDDYSDFSASELLLQLFTHPCSELVRTIMITAGQGSHPDHEHVFRAIGAGAPDTVRTLHVGDFREDGANRAGATVGDASAIWLALPNLEDLLLEGAGLTLGIAHAPTLERLVIRTIGIGREPITSLARAHVPALEFLELWIGDPEYGADVSIDDLEPLLSGACFPALTHLGLRNTALADAICDRLARSPLLGRLRSLDLSLGTMSDEGAAFLVAAAPKLEHLDVSASYLSPAMCERLQEIAAELTIGDQGEGDQRYVSVTE